MTLAIALSSVAAIRAIEQRDSMHKEKSYDRNNHAFKIHKRKLRLMVLRNLSHDCEVKDLSQNPPFQYRFRRPSGKCLVSAWAFS